MLIAYLAAATTALFPLGDPRAGHSPEWIRANCTVQPVHTPAGKPVQNRPIVRCAKVPEAK
jgi:hypothetical protein